MDGHSGTPEQDGGMPRLWSRRAVLGAMGLACAAALTGCGIRLEEDAPRIPLVPTREPVPDEAALVAALERSRHLARLAGRVATTDGPATASDLAALHQVQAHTLQDLLEAHGVPLPTTGPDPGRPSLAELGAQELADADADDLASLSMVSPPILPMLAAITAQRAAAGILLGAGTGDDPAAQGAPAAVSGPEAPGGLSGPGRDQAAALLRGIRPAVYGFEVITARTPREEREQAMTTLGLLQLRADQLTDLAAGSAASDPLGYALPYPVEDAEDRDRMARELLADLQRAVLARSAATAGDPAAVTGVVQLLTDAVVLGRRWDVPLSAFPGMALP